MLMYFSCFGISYLLSLHDLMFSWHVLSSVVSKCSLLTCSLVNLSRPSHLFSIPNSFICCGAHTHVKLSHQKSMFFYLTLSLSLCHIHFRMRLKASSLFLLINVWSMLGDEFMVPWRGEKRGTPPHPSQGRYVWRM